MRNLFLFIQQVDVIVLLIRGQSIGDSAAHTLVVSKREYASRSVESATGTVLAMPENDPTADPSDTPHRGNGAFDWAPESRRTASNAPHESTLTDGGSEKNATEGSPPRDPSELVREINSCRLPSDRERKKRRTKTVVAVVSGIVGGIVVLILIVQLALMGVKRTEQYALAHGYLISSEHFTSLGLDASRLRLYGYASTYDTSGATARFSFRAGLREFEVVCHKELGEWSVCTECTGFS